MPCVVAALPNFGVDLAVRVSVSRLAELFIPVLFCGRRSRFSINGFFRYHGKADVRQAGVPFC